MIIKKRQILAVIKIKWLESLITISYGRKILSNVYFIALVFRWTQAMTQRLLSRDTWIL